METVDKIDLHSQAEEIINSAINLKELAKFDKKIEKACLNNIVWGYKHCIRAYGFKFKGTFKDLINIHKEKGVDAIQKAYDKTKSELKDGEKIFNTNLEELGIKL